MKNKKKVLSWYAHIDTIPAVDSIIEFHLNIPAGETIPRIGDIVYPTSNNGYHAQRAKIISIGSSVRFHANDTWGLHMCPFISINYQAIIIE